MLRVCELFAGTGAFSIAWNRVGCKTVFSNDTSTDAKKIFDMNHKDVTLTCENIHDLHTVDIPAFDILTAGFPCQSFSIAGKKLGFADDRANVIWKMIEIIKHHRPSVILLENVKNIITHDNGNTLRTILKPLEEIGYILQYRMYNTCKMTNLPQNRERVFIAGFLDEVVSRRFQWPEPMKEPILPIHETDKQDDKYYYTSSSKIWDTIEKNITETHAVYQYRRGLVRKSKSGLVPCLTANMGTGGHNVPIIKDDYGIRKLTPRECFTLQGFPPDYVLVGSDSVLYKLAGNAVSVPVVELIAKSIMDAVNNNTHSLLLEYYMTFQQSCHLTDRLNTLYSFKNIRRPVFPECISEHLGYTVLKRLNNYIILDVKSGDMLLDGKRVEIKCSSSSGPLSFGPTQDWSRLYCIDASKFMTNASKTDFNTTIETYETLCKDGRRPRMSLQYILQKFSYAVLYNGSIINLLG